LHGYVANGGGAAGAYPEWRVRFLAGRRLNQDVVERPEAAAVREALLHALVMIASASSKRASASFKPKTAVGLWLR
jgi:hypothetical protein